MLLLPVFTGAGFARETLFLFNSDLSSSFYRARDEEGTLGINGSLSPAVIRDITDNRSLFAYYDISYDETSRAVEDEGIRWAERTLGQMISAGYTHELNDTTENRLTLLGYYEFTKGTNDENLAGGLYNFYDAGIKDEVTVYTSFMDRPAYLKSGAKLYYRAFPNYEGLYYLIYDEGPRWVKDYYGARLWVGSDIFWSEDTVINGGISYLVKIFRDDLVMIEPEGEMSYPYSDTRRIEHIFNLNTGVNRSITGWLRAGLYLDTEFRFGNQNYYDPARLDYIPSVYDYQQYSLSPVFNMKPLKDLACRLAYEIKFRGYFSNLAFDELGSYEDEKLYRLNHSANIELSYPLYNEFSARALASWNLSVSNNEYKRAAGYNYESFNFGMGINYEY